MGSFSIWHWLIVLVIVLAIFGTKKLRNIGGDLGGAVKGFKEAMNEENTPKVEDKMRTIEGEVAQKPAARKPAAKKPAVKKPVARKPVTRKSPAPKA